MDCGSTILIFIACIQATCGQSVTLTGPSAIKRGSDTVYTCTTTGASPHNFRWIDESVNAEIFIGGDVVYLPTETKYFNFGVSESGVTSTVTISNTQIEDEGQYRCSDGQGRNVTDLTVEVKGTWSLSAESTIKGTIDVYEATCEALDGRPNVTIAWMLGSASPCDDPVTSVTADSGLFDTTSVCTFQATKDNNNGQTLTCVISGHLVSELNGEVTTTLDMHRMPTTDITVGFQSPDTSLTVSCVIADPTQPIPSIRNYYIYSNGTLIHQSSMGDNDRVVPESEFDLYTEFICVAGNYLGNVTSDPTIFDPDTLEKTTKSGDETGSGPRTGLSTTEPSTTSIDPSKEPTINGLGPGAYAGIAIGVIACIVIIVVIVLYFLRPECCPCFAGSGIKSSGSSKPAGSAVGSSNGSEREKLPQAAPRGHGSIQHTNDNPDQAMYAMVDKKPARGGGGAGDAPDRGSAPGQNEPPGMLYADLDLSHKAGHTDKHVPKNENDVVVYSSILV